MSSSGSILPMSEDQHYGCAFIATSQRKPLLTLQDLIVDPEFIRRYIIYVQNKYGVIHPSAKELDNIVPQPSPVGLALIAHYYNNKGDQYTPILVCTSIEDFKSIVQKFSDSSENLKLVLLMQSTDNIAQEEMTYRSHKLIIYLEKRAAELHIVLGEVIPVASITQFYIQMAEAILKNHKRSYYVIDPIKIPEKNNDVVLQTDYWSCGTIAFRIGRVIAKTQDFLGSLKEVSRVQESNKAIIKYTFPIAFAKCADASIPRKHCEMFYRPDSDLLITHFKKHPADYPYTAHFTNKYVALIKSTVAKSTPEELNAIIDSSDVRHYSPEKAKPKTSPS